MSQQESDLPLDLFAPARRALTEAGYLHLEQLTRVSEAELKQLGLVLEARNLAFASGKSK